MLEYSFTFLEKQLEKYKMDLTDSKLVQFGLIDLQGEITYEGMLISDQCNHKIKLVDCRKEEKEIVLLSGSILQQYHTIKKELVGLTKQINFSLSSILKRLIEIIVYKDYSYNEDILVKIYNDKVEIVSLGDIIKKLTAEKENSRKKKVKNSNIIKIFHNLEIIEYGDD